LINTTTKLIHCYRKEVFNMQKVLITGGTGLVGNKICNLLKDNNIPFHVLSRHPKLQYEYKWDIASPYIDDQAFEGVDTLIHLAGAGVGDHRWTPTYKEVILQSRIQSTNLLYNAIHKNKVAIRHYIGASAVGYYGDTGNTLVEEGHESGKGFLAEVCRRWEQSHLQFEQVCATTIIRIGVVLSEDGGALPKLLTPAKLGLAPYFGKGEQYFPWIEMEDLVNILYKTGVQGWEGIYNAVAPEELVFKEFSKRLARRYSKIVVPISTPEMLPRMAMGEQADMLLLGQRVSSDKIIHRGYTFLHPQFM
jgi:uncharacterized protein (TIGR01777 family)